MQCVDLGGRRIIKKNFFKQKTAYEISECLVGSEMCIRDSNRTAYRTVLHIEAVLFTAERDGAEPVTVTAAYPVYEAVLAGDVPQYGVVRAG